ncbi:MAG: DUF2325 domain-containing protein [Thermaerobacter sp.]|nr:DUF2325 domain-containing protein [Thermaerobacter sp.]
MSIVLIGGHSRMHEHYRSLGRSLGHDVKVFTHMTANLEKCIGFPGAIVVFTSTVSHSMVTVAVKTARKKNIPLIKTHNSSKEALTVALSSFGLPE